MKYLLLVYSAEKAAVSMPKEEMEVLMGEYAAYTAEIQKSGVRLAGEALQPTSTATTVRVRNGKKITTHGPFAETIEQLGGYYLVECQNLDEAIEWAAKCPDARFGSIEVRPVMDYSQAQ